MIKITEQSNEYAKTLMKAFSQFRKIHWKPSHVQELKPSEFMVLHTVKHEFIEGDKSGLMVSEISSHLKIARPTVTQLVNGLERKGFLVKMPDDYDKRVVRIHLSDKGKDLAKKGTDEFYRMFKGLSESLGPQKCDDLAELLHDVFEYFQETEKTKG